ncbi:hypothetical protein IOD16_15200 [Saccharothrix sp. 6-C]|uniref:hypothetical protein n=1 Tax=Saccharothrix sp. 6-C TaxID=2781735 RepID=UPI0019177CE5|nr:hypothetical protein [Saccharothrix sp. 6-C]QQQ79618.1 hypothetical protein IOD16_15200 [Saccharothrix sp. 6-C]
MSGGEPAPTTGAVNWDAYSHEELYRMLWQDADVADVSVVATEWAQHRVALDTHAGVLREQRVALLDGWHGPAAEEAADRLAALAARVEKISELAHAGHRAAQEAADALARARAMMPPPPAAPADPAAGDRADDRGSTTRSAFATAFPPVAPPTMPTAPAIPVPPPPPAFPSAPTFPAPPPPLTFPSAPAALAFPTAPGLPAIPTSTPASFSSVPDFASMFAPTGTTTASGTGAAFGAVGGAGFSFYFGASTLDQQKADAVRAMQTYESSLVGGSKLIDGARGAIPPASQTTSANGPAAGGVPGGPTTGTRGGGVPWTRLLGGGGSGIAPGTGSAIGGSAPPSGHGVPLGPGSRVGVPAGAGGAFGLPVGPLTGDAAARGTTQAAMAPPVGARATGDDDEPHENRMPTIDHGLFTVDEPVSPAVIGQTTGAQQ